MGDLISRSAFAEEVESLEITVAGKPARWHDAKHTVLRRIAEAPAVDAVEVVHGYNTYDHDSAFECSVCGFSDWDTMTADTGKYNYCPSCGARMDGDRNARLIDADKIDTRERGNNSQRTMWWNIKRLIDSAPTIEAEPVRHGRWDDSGRYRFPSGNIAVRCTECGCALTASEYRLYRWNYCPNCGAKMDGGKEDGT